MPSQPRMRREAAASTRRRDAPASSMRRKGRRAALDAVENGGEGEEGAEGMGGGAQAMGKIEMRL